MEEISAFALAGGVAAVIVPAVAAIINIGRLLLTNGNHLVLKVGGQKFVIDLGSIDRTDITVIDSATQAVEQKAKATF